MKKSGFISKVFYVLNIALAVFTLIGYASPYISPGNYWPIAFFGLAMPYLLILNLIYIFYWLFRAKSKFILSLLILALGYQVIPKYIQFQFGKKEAITESLKVMSFNVRVFDLYMWTKEKTTRDKIFRFLKEENPDVLCLQEFYHMDKQNPKYEFKTLDTMVQFLTAKNYHVYYTTTVRNNDHWGLITFSKYPIVEKGVVPFEKGSDNACIYSDIKVNNKITRVYNAHLASIKLAKRDYKTMQKLNEKDYSNFLGKGWSLVKKIRHGFEKRANQAELIRGSIEDSPHPTIVCGDFNDSPTSYSYQTIKGDLTDTYRESGSGLGRTYIGEFPSFRIDYIFTDSSFTSSNYTTHPIELSDHHPISTTIHF